MLHNGGPVPNYNQSMAYYDYPNVGHQYSAQHFNHAQNTFKGFEDGKFAQAAANYTQSGHPDRTNKVTGYSDDEVQHQILEPKCYDEKKLSSAAKYKMVDFGSPEAAVDPSQRTANVSSPECPVKQQTIPTFAWMINSSEDGKRRRQSYSRKQTLELEKEFCYSQYLTKKRRSELCHMLQLSEKQIKTWFQNRRMKKKKENEKQKVDVNRSIDFHHNLSQESAEGASQFWNSPKSAVSPVKESYGVTNVSQYPQHAHQFYFNNNSYDVNFG